MSPDPMVSSAPLLSGFIACARESLALITFSWPKRGVYFWYAYSWLVYVYYYAPKSSGSFAALFIYASRGLSRIHGTVRH